MNPRASFPWLWLPALGMALACRSVIADPRPAPTPPAPIAAPNAPAAVPALFGLTNLWTLHLVVPAADWQTLGSRGGPQERRGMNNPGGSPPGIVGGILRGFFGGPDQPEGRPASARPPAPAEGGSRYPWAHCTVEADGQIFTNVAIRFKGVSSVVRAPNGYKRPFKLDFDREVGGRRFKGVGEVYLNNNVNDATQMREALAYDLFRKSGIAAPHTA
ncbi:MAG: hypothetical protein DVB31_11960 [Verrucomicrobia bacterium]|nr:MAG: hypothetical protein DVB31_11960 [Verrucomicrobiota bacterium]